MTARFLSDAAAWLCICAARLSELGFLSQDDCEATALELFRDPILGRLDPIHAAEAQAAAGPSQIAA